MSKRKSKRSTVKAHDGLMLSGDGERMIAAPRSAVPEQPSLASRFAAAAEKRWGGSLAPAPREWTAFGMARSLAGSESWLVLPATQLPTRPLSSGGGYLVGRAPAGRIVAVVTQALEGTELLAVAFGDRVLYLGSAELGGRIVQPGGSGLSWPARRYALAEPHELRAGERFGVLVRNGRKTTCGHVIALEKKEGE